MWRWLRWVLAAGCLGLTIYCGTQLYLQQQEYDIGVTTYEQLASHVHWVTQPTLPDGSIDVDSPDFSLPEVDFDALRAINPDVVGWLIGMGDTINYPVVQGADNSYYLTHLFDDTYNSSGSLFLDCENAADLSDTNSIIYGHNMRNDTMFEPIEQYRDPKMIGKHPTMLLMTPDKAYQLRLFSGYVTSVEDMAWRKRFASQEEHQTWLDYITASSCFAASVRPTVRDRIVTLSTCSYDFNEARFVLFGILEPLPSAK